MVAVTAKEMPLATPGFLLLASVLVTRFENKDAFAAPRIRRELLRLLPFFAVLPAYYFFHIAKIAPGTFYDSGPYRNTANWGMILANVRKFPLWIVRIYAYSDETLSGRFYQSTALNNIVGICALALVAVQWGRRVRLAPSSRLVLLLMLGWTAVYLVLPIYSGGYVWHINLTVIGYSVLFGFALAWCFDAIASPPPSSRRDRAVPARRTPAGPHQSQDRALRRHSRHRIPYQPFRHSASAGARAKRSAKIR